MKHSYFLVALLALSLFACKSDNEPEKPDDSREVGDAQCVKCTDIVINGMRQNANGYELIFNPGETEKVLEFYVGFNPLISRDVVALDLNTQLMHKTVSAELVTPCWWDEKKGGYVGAEPCGWVNVHLDQDPVYHQYVKVSAPDLDTDQRALIHLSRSGLVMHDCLIEFFKKAAKK